VKIGSMNKKYASIGLCVVVTFFMPTVTFAQGGLADDIKSLHEVLGNLYKEMIPLCKDLIGVGRGIAGFAATWYIGSRIWRHIANAEPIDFYPLFRPFVLGFAILIFPSVIAMIDGVMKPTVTGTEQMVKNSDAAIAQLLKMKQEAIKKTIYWQMYVGESGDGDQDKWYKYNHPGEEEGWFEGIGNSVRFAIAKASYKFRNAIKQWMSEVLQVIFAAAALCINTIRTFYLIILAILGPLVFGIAVFDGFQHSLTVWIARYINIFLWLPVANIFGAVIGKVQENMLKIDLSQIQQGGDTFFSSTDAAYLVFMIIGIVGYFTVPSVANYIIHAGGGNSLLDKVSSISMTSTRATATTAASATTSMAKDVYGDIKRVMQSGMATGSAVANYFKDKISGK
jgi:conjugative transposon TraJ protein